MAGRCKAVKVEVGLAEREPGVQIQRGVGRGRAQRLTAEGAALCATPCGADERGPDIMCIMRCEPLHGIQVNCVAERRISHNSPTLC
ncbi:hypothetical protein [Xenorhabdus szentirmaii]|uniref:Uncharacterized protein n=2 Tax=Xenorhabdus szentirmaii TaxID=290112 RepID=W1IWC8_9GAMM|nr:MULTISPECIES: hypothetical protein [Xenorhabdus]MBD2803019.1 hypothetical protein [Xenorhabdus sp. M]CDL81515.1 conserved hypothetical protein [Xenorhabdus szentirmaii DSM 16338]